MLEGPEGHISPMMNPDGYMEAKAIWLRLIEDEPRNVVFLRHAVSFFTLSDTELSVDLLQRAESVEPANPDWARELGPNSLAPGSKSTWRAGSRRRGASAE